MATIIASLAVIVFVWASFYYHVQALRQLTVDRAHATVLAQSRVLREYAEQAFGSVSIALRALDSRPELRGIQAREDSYINHLLLRRLRDSNPLVEGIGLIDRSGRILASAESHPPPQADLSDRDYFKLHRESPTVQLLIGPPIVTRPGNTYAIPVSRRLVDEAGDFAGVAAARIRPALFEELYRSSNADVVEMYLSDGAPLVRMVAGAEGSAPGIAPPAFSCLPAVSTERVELCAAKGRAGEWLMGYSPSQQYPIVVAVGLETEKLLADWRANRDILAAVAVITTIVILMLTLLLVTRLRRDARMADMLRREREAADAARLSAETANRSKSEFLSHMSHELRTPLNAISGFSEMMLAQMFGPIGNPRYIEYAGIVNSSAAHLISIINNILDLAKVESGKWEIEPEPLVLSEMAGDLAALTTGRAHAEKVKLMIEFPPTLPVVVTDRRLLLQVLVNLTTNGLKFTSEGGSVTVTARADSGGVAIEIADTGCGMSAEDIVRVLQPFGRASSLLARQHHDTGLGLPLSKRFVELLGGRLEIDSIVGRGTRVVVHLPSSSPMAPPVAERFEAASP